MDTSRIISYPFLQFEWVGVADMSPDAQICIFAQTPRLTTFDACPRNIVKSSAMELVGRVPTISINNAIPTCFISDVTIPSWQMSNERG